MILYIVTMSLLGVAKPPRGLYMSLIATIKLPHVHTAKEAAKSYLLECVMEMCLGNIYVIILEGTMVRCSKFLKAKRWLFDSIGRDKVYPIELPSACVDAFYSNDVPIGGDKVDPTDAFCSDDVS